MSNLLSAFILAQVYGVSATALFMGSTMSPGGFNLVSIVGRSKLPSTWRAHLYGCLITGSGRQVFLTTGLGGAAAFLTAYLTRPAHIPVGQGSALLAAATALVGAVVHTAVWMVPIYSALGDQADFGTEAQTQERWAGLMKRFQRGNLIRLTLFATAHALGIYGLAVSRVGAGLFSHKAGRADERQSPLPEGRRFNLKFF
ncbi:hypothetical protein C8R47DRAFT_1251650 [Mycena vitilis]|nr:hypothetical protein C8R47DRAFT_1251650 [Mycena vitilis]